MAVPRACFYPNGSPATAASGSPRMLPCLPNAINSACCASNDSCLANGMCLSEDLFFYRGACTTVQYPSDSCPQFCIKSTDPGNSYNNFQPLSLCDIPGTKIFTCSTNQANCKLGNFTLSASEVEATNITGFPPNSTSTTPVKTTGISTTDLTIATVVPIVALILLGSVLWYWEHRKRTKAVNEAKNWERTAESLQLAQMQGNREEERINAKRWESAAHMNRSADGNEFGGVKRTGTDETQYGSVKRSGTAETLAPMTPLSELSGTGSPVRSDDAAMWAKKI